MGIFLTTFNSVRILFCCSFLCEISFLNLKKEASLGPVFLISWLYSPLLYCFEKFWRLEWVTFDILPPFCLGSGASHSHWAALRCLLLTLQPRASTFPSTSASHVCRDTWPFLLFTTSSSIPSSLPSISRFIWIFFLFSHFFALPCQSVGVYSHSLFPECNFCLDHGLVVS